MRRGSHYRGGGRGASQQGIHHAAAKSPPLESIVARLETLSRLLLAVGRHATRPEEILEEIRLMYQDLTRAGPQLEAAYPDVLDRAISSMRDASAHPSLPPPLRLAIFQMVELRASHWSLPTDTTKYYTQRSQNNQDGSGPGGGDSLNHDSTVNDSEQNLQPKTCFQEVIIKNSDSGKVMGVRGRRVRRIENLSDTIISFEKVLPTAKERTLFINGHSDNSIQIAKHLIDETIERNASPVLDVEATNSESAGSPSSLSPSADGPEFSYSIQLGQHVIRISGTHLPFVQEGKLALDEHFLRKFPHLFYDAVANDPDDVDAVLQPTASPASLNGKRRYGRQDLLEIELNSHPNASPQFLATLDPSIRKAIVLPKRRVLHPGFLKSE